MVTLNDPFPYYVPLDKAVQWACYYSLWCWIFAIFVGAKSYKQQNWTSHKENLGCGIRRWCHHIRDSTRSHSSKRWPPPDLRKGNRCSFEHTKIQSHGCRSVGCIDKYDGHPILPGISLLGFRLASTVDLSGNVTCSRVAGKVKALASDVYGRDLYLTQSI
jgi:hypothetical protein